MISRKKYFIPNETNLICDFIFLKSKNVSKYVRSDRCTDRSFFIGGKREEMIWDDSPDFQFDIKMILKFFLTFHTLMDEVNSVGIAIF